MEHIKTKKELQNQQHINYLKSSKDFELTKDKKITIRDTIFRYKYPKKGWDYLFTFDSDLKSDPILYLHDLTSDKISFLDYFGRELINKLHDRLTKQYSEYEGSVKFFESVVKVEEFIKSLPSEEEISDYWIYLEDSGYKIEGINYGFLENQYKDDEHTTYNLYQIPSGTENEISILIEISKKLDMKDMEVYNHLEEFNDRMIKLVKGIKKIEITNSFGGSNVIISFNWSFN